MNYFEDILYYMNEVEKVKCLHNTEKKAYVLKKLKEQIGEDNYNKYDVLIDNAIEFLIKLSYKELKIKFNRMKKNCVC